jgi:hypothetical protein
MCPSWLMKHSGRNALIPAKSRPAVRRCALASLLRFHSRFIIPGKSIELLLHA